MKTTFASVLRFLRDEEGATAIEYALMAALIAVVIAATVALLGTEVNKVFAIVKNCMAGRTSATCV